MKTRIKKTLSMMIAAMLLLGCLPAMAESPQYDGNMSITIGTQTMINNGVAGGIELEAFLIAKGDYGVWTPVKDFSDIKITARDDGSAWIDQSMKQLGQRIKDRGLRPAKTATTHNNGKAYFSGMEHGIYYIRASKTPDPNTRVSAMLLSTPNKEGNLNITANGKVEYNAPPPEDEEEDDKPQKPHVPMIIVPTRRGERLVSIDEYETALGLGNIQMHVGVCFE